MWTHLPGDFVRRYLTRNYGLAGGTLDATKHVARQAELDCLTGPPGKLRLVHAFPHGSQVALCGVAHPTGFWPPDQVRRCRDCEQAAIRKAFFTR